MFIHRSSDVQSNNIGNGTNIWQFCVVLENATIGKDCNIGAHCYIENQVVIGNRVTIKNSVSIFDSIYIEDDVFIGPNVTFTNTSYPSSKRKVGKVTIEYPETIVREGAVIGGGCTILPGIQIGKQALIGAGAVITKNIPDGAVYYGEGATYRNHISKIIKTEN